jgi:hypothetical protein
VHLITSTEVGRLSRRRAKRCTLLTSEIVRKYFLPTSEKFFFLLTSEKIFFLLTSDSVVLFANYFHHTVLLEKYNIKKHHALNLLEEIAETSFVDI